MSTNTQAMVGYTDAIQNLPEEAFLGSLLFFSICQADVNLDQARAELIAAGLPTDGLRKNLRPIDAFRKSSKRFERKFKVLNGVRSELMVRPVGEDGEQSFRHLVLERAVVQAGKKRRVFYEKVGELTFTRGLKKDGEYVDHGVECRRTTGHLPDPLTAEEDQWLTEQLATFEDNYDHLLHYMDSHAVRTFVRESIYDLDGTCVKETGGLYFVRQKNVDAVSKLSTWVNSVGSEFHSLPLLNLTEQKVMIAEAFEVRRCRRSPGSRRRSSGSSTTRTGRSRRRPSTPSPTGPPSWRPRSRSTTPCSGCEQTRPRVTSRCSASR